MAQVPRVGRAGDGTPAPPRCRERPDAGSRFPADRAFRVAGQTGSGLLVGAAQLRVANVYLSASRHAEAIAVAAAAADNLPPTAASPPAAVATFGALLLTAAVATARMGEATQAWKFLGHAKAAAVLIGHEQADLFAVFGPVNLAVHGVQVATDLGDGPRLRTGTHAISRDSQRTSDRGETHG
jgi:hypothetical protein